MSEGISYRVLTISLIAVWLATVGVVLFAGLDYYKTPLPDRPFSDLYELHKPSGNIGHGLGITGSAFIVIGVSFYSLRKRAGWLSSAGRLAIWLEVHIFLCTLGPVLVLFHTTFKFGGIVSIAFWSMTIVALSGVFGRYLYGRVPKTIDGHFRSLAYVRQQEAELLTRVSEEFGLSPERTRTLVPRSEGYRARGVAHALVLAVRFDLSRRSLKGHVRKLLAEALEGTNGAAGRLQHEKLVGLLQQRLQLERQIVLLEPFQRLFGYWHLLHLPLAGVMLVIMLLHITVSVLFGYTWVF